MSLKAQINRCATSKIPFKVCLHICVRQQHPLAEVKVITYLLWQTTSSPDARQHIFSSVTRPDFFSSSSFFPRPPLLLSLSRGSCLILFQCRQNSPLWQWHGLSQFWQKVTSSSARGGWDGWREGGGKEEVVWRDGGRADARGEMRGRRRLSTSVLVQMRIELFVQDSHWLGGHMCLSFHWTGPSLSASHLHLKWKEKMKRFFFFF